MGMAGCYLSAIDGFNGMMRDETEMENGGKDDKRLGCRFASLVVAIGFE